MIAIARIASLLGLDLSAVGADSVRRAVRGSMRRLGLGSQEEYLAVLKADPKERCRLTGETVVQESWLFRDSETFSGLAGLACSLSGPLRALSVPCAAGEEPASMAVALLKAGIRPDTFFIDAVDANPGALARARSGRFGPASVRGGLEPYAGFFEPDGQDLVLSKVALSRIRFLEGDVLDSSFLQDEPPYQVIFCRHLLIYLDRNTRARLAHNITRLLGDEGVLFTSPAEACAFMELGLTPYPRPAVCLAPPNLDRPVLRKDPAASRKCPSPLSPPPASAPVDDLAARARELADAGNMTEALDCIGKALAELGPSATLYHLKGAALLALGRDDEAEEALKRAVYLNPGHQEALTHLELLTHAKGRADEAARWAVRARRAREVAP